MAGAENRACALLRGLAGRGRKGALAAFRRPFAAASNRCEKWLVRQGANRYLAGVARPDRNGEVAEWLNAPHSKCGILARVSGVRIPPSPPDA